jgi:uncharacterized protein YegP (UPF0339 family)
MEYNATFRIYRNKKGGYYFELKACNGKILHTSLNYTRKINCELGLVSLIHAVNDAKTIDMTK